MDIYLLTDSLSMDGAGQKIKDNNEDNSLAPQVRSKPTNQNPNVKISSLKGVDYHTEPKSVFYDDIKQALSGYVRIIKFTNDSVCEYVRNESNIDIGTSQRITIKSTP